MIKYAAIALGVAIIVAGSWWVKATYLEAGSAMVTKYRDVDAAMRLNVQGEDLRVYEFTPQKAPHLICIFVAGTSKASLECDLKANAHMTPQEEP